MANHSESKEVKSESSSTSKGGSGGGGSSKSAPMPKDAQVMVSVLRDMGVTEHDPRVVAQLLEFSYRYATDVLEDARAVSAHARKRQIDLDDVRLAARMRAEQGATSPPGREVLLDVARAKNAAPLPVPRATCGLRLPPDRHCLTATNYRIRFKSRPPRAAMAGIKVGGGGSRFASSKLVSQPKVMVGQPPTFPPLVAGGMPGMAPTTIKLQQPPTATAGVMPSIQITPQGGDAAGGQQQQQPMFKISVAPQALGTQAAVSTTPQQKRKAEEMDY